MAKFQERSNKIIESFQSLLLKAKFSGPRKSVHQLIFLKVCGEKYLKILICRFVVGFDYS